MEGHLEALDLSAKHNSSLSDTSFGSVSHSETRQRRYSAVLKTQAIQKFMEGWTKADISREMEVPESTLRGWIKAAETRGECATKPSPKSSPKLSPLVCSASTAKNYSPNGTIMRTQAHQLSSTPTDSPLNLTIGKAKHRKYIMTSREEEKLKRLKRIQLRKDIFNDFGGRASTKTFEMHKSLMKAIKHGEKLLNWMEKNSKVGILPAHIEQDRNLLDNIKPQEHESISTIIFE